MALDRTLWLASFAKDWLPAWPCPGCGATSLSPVDKTWRAGASARSLVESRKHPHDATTDEGVCCLLIRCGRPDCRETCAVIGRYETWDVDDEDSPGLQTVCTPAMIEPPPPIIRLPAACPKPVKREVGRDFALFWSDHAACLNSIRHAIELVLADLGVPPRHRVTDKKTGAVRIERFVLHQRIDRLRKQRPRMASLCERLVAVKHLGNAGSHPGDVFIEDALDCFEIVEDVLAAVYGDGGRLEKTVKEINKRKGPRRRKV
jgi:Domain of unknown function (DUF4145)